MTVSQNVNDGTLVGYRFGRLHAERKDLDAEGLDKPKHVEVDFDFDVKVSFDLEAVEADLQVKRDLWDSNIVVRVKGVFHFDKPFDTMRAAAEFARTVALIRTFHVCAAEVDRLARELDVTVLAVPLDVESGLQDVKPQFVGTSSYEAYDPAYPARIEPEWISLGEGRVAVERTHTWEDVAAHFAHYFDKSSSDLLDLIKDKLDRVGSENVAAVADAPTDTEACEFMHELCSDR